jgi:hypothetical protein
VENKKTTFLTISINEHLKLLKSKQVLTELKEWLINRLSIKHINSIYKDALIEFDDKIKELSK